MPPPLPNDFVRQYPAEPVFSYAVKYATVKLDSRFTYIYLYFLLVLVLYLPVSAVIFAELLES